MKTLVKDLQARIDKLDPNTLFTVEVESADFGVELKVIAVKAPDERTLRLVVDTSYLRQLILNGETTGV